MFCYRELVVMHVADLLRVKADLIDIQHYSPWITLRVLYNPKQGILVRGTLRGYSSKPLNIALFNEF